MLVDLNADILLLLDLDCDMDGQAATALQEALAEGGVTYPYRVAGKPNAGVPSGFDLDGNGRLGEGRDGLGYGRFTGDGGMLLLSKWPLGPVRDLSATLWADRDPQATALLPEGAASVVPLANVAQWVVPVSIGGTDLSLVTLAANTPVFDGPEDRNGKRNAAELAFVSDLAAAEARPVVLGRANVDPADGEGDRSALADLLGHPALQDPRPRGAGGGGAGHSGDPALDTVEWDGPGPLRVDYVLPAAGLTVTAAGVVWPDDPDALAVVRRASRGRAVWVDIALP